MRIRTTGFAALFLALALGASGCTGGTDSSPKPSGSSSSGSENPADRILSFVEAPPIAETTGSIAVRGGQKSDATAQVVSLIAGKSSTVLLFRLSTAEEVTPDTSFLEYDDYGRSVDGVSLTAGDTVLYPSTYRYGAGPLAQQCVCSQQVTTLGPEGVYLSADFGALPAGTSEATLTIPGLKPVQVEVTAAG